ncbi:Chondroitin polymerase [uncultured Clostridium sp.]|nr:Chondroitin polymerase [uncultured Clostridium sp.]
MDSIKNEIYELQESKALNMNCIIFMLNENHQYDFYNLLNIKYNYRCNFEFEIMCELSYPEIKLVFNGLSSVIIKNFAIFDNQKECSFMFLNGVAGSEGQLFNNEIPQVQFICKNLDSCKKIKISMDIISNGSTEFMEKYIFLSESYKALQGIINTLQQETHMLAQYKEKYESVTESTIWKSTKGLRLLLDKFKTSHYTRLLYKSLIVLKNEGFHSAIQRLKNRERIKVMNTAFVGEYDIDEGEANVQINKQMKRDIKFSIIVPLYNTKKEHLIEMIESVLKQTYGNYELCLADGSDKGHDYINKIIKNYRNQYDNIKYIKISKNKGISGNTIEAFKLANGDFFVLLDHDDILTRNALFELVNVIHTNQYEADFIYSDRGIFDDGSKEVLAYHFLPGFSPDFMRACNYASHLNAFSKYIIEQVGFIREGYDGSQDYEFELRVMEKARRVIHINKVLYYCRACEGSVALDPTSKMYAYEAGKKAIEEHIARIGHKGKVEFLKDTFSYRIHYDINQADLVDIIIPNKNHLADLKRCINSILNKTSYKNYMVTIVENNSSEKEVFEYYDEISKYANIRVLRFEINEFNFSAINNYAVSMSDGKYVLFLNNDIEIINNDWLNEMLMFAQRDDVGAVGAKLYYPNDTNQHVGLLVGLGGHIASHYDYGKNKNETGYMHRLTMPQNYDAVTAACLLVKKDDFVLVDGFDTVNFKIGLNDVDLCLKLRELGKYNIVTPYAEMYHYESASRGRDDSGEAKKRFEKETMLFREKWNKYFDLGSEYINPNYKI